MRTAEEQALAAELKDATAGGGFDETRLAGIVGRGRRRRTRTKVIRATLAAASVAVLGGAGVAIWQQASDDGGTVAAPEAGPAPGQPDPEITEAFALTKSVVDPLLPPNAGRPDFEQFHLALNHETGDAVLYLPNAGDVDIDQLADDAVAAVQAAPGAAPVVPVLGTALIDELDGLSVELFNSRAEWAPDPAQVLFTIPRLEDVSVTIGVADLAVADNLPKTMQLPSGATAAIHFEKSTIFYE